MPDRREKDSERYRRRKRDKQLQLGSMSKNSGKLLRGRGKLMLRRLQERRQLQLLRGKLKGTLKRGGRKLLEMRKRGGASCGFFRDGLIEHDIPSISSSLLIKSGKLLIF